MMIVAMHMYWHVLSVLDRPKKINKKIKIKKELQTCIKVLKNYKHGRYARPTDR